MERNPPTAVRRLNVGPCFNQDLDDLYVITSACDLQRGESFINQPNTTHAVVGATCQLVSWTRAIPAVVVTMFEVTSDTSNVIPMLIFSMLSRSITNLFGLDGWAHSVFHENASLPKHKVRPQYWRDNETLPAEDRKVFDHGHGHGGNRSDEVVEDGTGGGGGGGVRHHADKNDRSSHTRMSMVDGRMTMVNPDRRLSRNLTVHSENPMHGDSDDKIPESHL